MATEIDAIVKLATTRAAIAVAASDFAKSAAINARNAANSANRDSRIGANVNHAANIVINNTAPLTTFALSHDDNSTVSDVDTVAGHAMYNADVAIDYVTEVNTSWMIAIDTASKAEAAAVLAGKAACVATRFAEAITTTKTLGMTKAFAYQVAEAVIYASKHRDNTVAFCTTATNAASNAKDAIDKAIEAVEKARAAENTANTLARKNSASSLPVVANRHVDATRMDMCQCQSTFATASAGLCQSTFIVSTRPPVIGLRSVPFSVTACTTTHDV